VTKHSKQNIITTLPRTNTLEVEEGHNDDDDDDNDTNIPDEAIEAPNYNDYHEPLPLTISHFPRPRITRALQS
jgi:hypothetical protein